jgi:hypothetical protein
MLGVTTKQQEATHAKRHIISNRETTFTARHAQIGHETQSVPRYEHAYVMRLHAVITTAHGSGAPMRVANARGERES